jgi:two-component system chemotaxis response regulator CheB
VVLHISPGSPSALAGILERAGPLPCHPAEDGRALRAGEILVAPPDRHLAIEDGVVRVTVGPRENGHRPAVDVLFRSAAAERGERVVGVVLSGTRDDGAAGLAMIKEHGGAAVVQSPEDALYAGMPSSAIASVNVDAIAPVERMGETIVAVVKGDQPPEDARPYAPAGDPGAGRRLTAVCPECGGVLTEEVEAGAPYWACHVGHRYSPTSFADAQAQGVEASLWTAVRALRDRGALLERMAEQSGARGASRSSRRYLNQATEARNQAELVLDALTRAASTTLRNLSSDEPQDEAQATAEESG